MSLVESPRALRERLRNPANAVPDLGIDLKRPPTLPTIQAQAPPPVAAKPLPDGRGTRTRLPDETDVDFAERQIKYYRDRLAAAVARREQIFGKRRCIRIENIQDAVCTVFGVSKIDLLSRRKPANLVKPRHVAMYLATKMTEGSLPEIAHRFGGRDHTTILHAARRIEGQRIDDPALNVMIVLVEKLCASIMNPEDAPCRNSPPTTAQ
jgi:hypothetical protein